MSILLNFDEWIDLKGANTNVANLIGGYFYFNCLIKCSEFKILTVFAKLNRYLSFKKNCVIYFRNISLNLIILFWPREFIFGAEVLNLFRRFCVQ